MGCCKYKKQVRQISYDSGVTWQNVYPAEYRKGDNIESFSNDCCTIDTQTVYMEKFAYGDTGGFIWTTSDAEPIIYRHTIDESVSEDTYYEILLLDNVVEIADYAFEELPHMRRIAIGNGVTNIGDYAFIDSSSLIEVYLKGLTPPSLGTDVFRNISPIPTIYVPDSAVNTYKAASGWSSYSSYIQPVSSKGRKAYIECGNDIYIMDYDGIAFLQTDYVYFSEYISQITIPKDVVSSMTYLEIGDCVEVFKGHIPFQSLTGVSFGNSLTFIKGGIGGSNVQEMALPASLRSISDQSFNNNPDMSGMTVYATTPPTLGANSLINTNNCPIFVPADSVTAYKAATGWSGFESRIQGLPTPVPTDYKLTANYAGGGDPYLLPCDDSTTLTGEEVRSGSTPYSSMTSAVIGDCVTSIGISAFAGCTNLTSITIPNSVSVIDISTFSSCSNLTGITIPSSVTTIGNNAFSYCSSLSSVSIPSSVTSIGSSTFSYCSNLMSLIIASGVTEIGTQFVYECHKLTGITFTSSVPPTIEYETFTGTSCPIFVPAASVNAYKTATNWSNYSSRIYSSESGIKLTVYSPSQSKSVICDGTTNITSGDVRTDITYTAITNASIGDCVSSIDTSAFRGCGMLSTITIPENITNIGDNAFRGCSGLPSIIIPSGVTSIGSSAFRDCSSLTSITVLSTTPPTIGTYVFNSTNNCPIYVPAESVETYKTASGWSTYASRIQAIPE